jgi:hypothetical protein
MRADETQKGFRDEKKQTKGADKKGGRLRRCKIAKQKANQSKEDFSSLKRDSAV